MATDRKEQLMAYFEQGQFLGVSVERLKQYLAESQNDPALALTTLLMKESSTKKKERVKPMTQNERYFTQKEASEAYEDKLKSLKFKHPKMEREKLDQLGQLKYPKLFRAMTGDFDDSFNVKSYSEDEPVFETPADELAHRAKIYALENDLEYSEAAAIILDEDPDLAERYKMT
jgi:hypothetical protein